MRLESPAFRRGEDSTFTTATAQPQIDGLLWPAGLDVGTAEIFTAPISKTDANALLEHWDHPLGPYNRPFGHQAWGLAVNGHAAGVVVSASTVGSRSAGYLRREVVELARIARSPEHPGIMRVLLRLWRDYLPQQWTDAYWPVKAAVSYTLPGKAGQTYRLDGWRFHGICKPWTYTGGYSKPSAANRIEDGVKRLYSYEFPTDTST